jgi:predicted glycogen debranching enzyme
VNPGLKVEGLGLDILLSREWLATNGIGGYACSTVPGLNTRKYHGLLVAAMSPPVRRMVILSRVQETIWRDGTSASLDCNEYPGIIHPLGYQFLREFYTDPSPRWIYQVHGCRVQKELHLLRGRNAVALSYRLLEGRGPMDLELRPLLALRSMHELRYQSNGPVFEEDSSKRQHHIPPTSHTPEFFFSHNGRFSPGADWYLNQIYRREEQRGYAGLEDLWTPGFIRWRLSPGHVAHFIGSTEPIEIDEALELANQHDHPRPAHASADSTFDALHRAASQFVVSIPHDDAEPSPHCITGYPWAAPSGREMLIAFTGAFLVPGKFAEARSLLLMFASRLRHGLMPSRFPENGGEPEYLGADVSLWFVNAMWDYLRYTGDDTVTQRLLDSAGHIINDYRHGTDLGITVGTDLLLGSRAPGIPTSWMDAKIGDWVLTPRIGRTVELNALWYNAVRIVAELRRRYGRTDRADSLTELAAGIKKSFNLRFWNEPAGCCFDVVEDHGNDPSIRPNQLFAIGLPFPVLDVDRHEKVLERVRLDLLTPFGMRTLSPADPCYQGHYFDGIVSRDRAYHNGSAFPWLLGVYVSAFLKMRGRDDAARQYVRDLLKGAISYMNGDGLGQICELFDGDPPHAPGGAIASAAAVAEILRCYHEDVLDKAPAQSGAMAAHHASEVASPAHI